MYNIAICRLRSEVKSIKGTVIFNKYYTDEGMQFIGARMKICFESAGIELINPNFYVQYPVIKSKPCDFAVFFDKDTALARYLENLGVKVFNSAKTIELCDDKEKTFSALSGISGILLPKTLSAPLMYDVSNNTDKVFLDKAESIIGFPAIVKENTGSQGRQVYLAKNRAELESLYSKLKRKPHCVQSYIGDNAGEDVRVYVVGKKAMACVKRINTTDFRSNASVGGKIERIELPKALKAQAELIAEALNLEYGSTDFILHKGNFYFIEANTSAYMKNAINNGIELDKMLMNYILEAL